MFCETCEKKPTCKEICKEVKSYLKSQGIYNPDYIRPQLPNKLRDKGKYAKWREIPFSSLNRDMPHDKNPLLS